MTRAVEITGNEPMQVFLEFHATRWPNWRRQRCLFSERGCWIELPDGTDDPEMTGVKVRSSMPAHSELSSMQLGDLWKYFAPGPRDRSLEGPPACWLLLVQDAAGTVGDQVIDQAPFNLERLELQEITGGASLPLYAYLIHGDAGRMLAQVPPPGCTAYECENLPRNLLAALPLGWSPPRLPDELWPEGGERVALYGRGSSTSSDVRVLTVTKRLPLARMLTMEPTVHVPLARNEQRLLRSSWRVLRAPTYTIQATEDVDEVDRRPAVFRFKTYDQSRAMGAASQSPKGHELGAALLQALDECEVGLLPDFRYASHDHDELERWHLLYSDQVDSQLLDAWNLVERFDPVDELVRHGLQVFVSTASRMLPPFQAVLVGDGKDAAWIEHIREMLGNPEDDAIVLIEDMDDPLGPSSGTGPRGSASPRIIHLPPPKGLLFLRSVIRKIIKPWHNAEPIHALAAMGSPQGVSEYREVLETRLIEIATEESGELRAAAEATQQDFATWARALMDAVEKNSVDVRSANDVCEGLNTELRNADASIGEACTALLRLANLVTEPRRAWITQQSQQLAFHLQSAAPLTKEIQEVHTFAASATPQLRTATEKLARASVALEALEPDMMKVGADADVCLARARSTQGSIEAAAVRMITDVTQRRALVAEKLAAAMREQTKVQAVRDALIAERVVLDELEIKNRAQHARNVAARKMLDVRTKAAAEESARLEQVRSVEIPEQSRLATEAERKLMQMDRGGIEAKLSKVNGEIKRIDAEILSFGARVVVLNEARDEATKLKARVVDAQIALKTADSEATKAQSDLAAQEPRLERLIKEKGDIERAQDRLKLIKETLLKLEKIRTNPAISILNPFTWRRGNS